MDGPTRDSFPLRCVALIRGCPQSGVRHERIIAPRRPGVQALLTGLGQLVPTSDGRAPANDLVIIDSPGRPLQSGAYQVFEATGASLQCWSAAELDAWIDVVSTTSTAPHETLDRIVAHLTESAQPLKVEPVAYGSAAAIVETVSGVVEDRSLIGGVGLNAVFTRPATDHDRSVAVLFLSTVGPGGCLAIAARDFAATGTASLRIDFAGFRESGTWPWRGKPSDTLSAH